MNEPKMHSSYVDALSPIFLFIAVHYLNRLPKIFYGHSRNTKTCYLSEYLAGFSTAFLIFARGSWILYFKDEIGVDVNLIIFSGTVIQGIFSSFSIPGSGSPLGLYHQKYLEMAKTENKTISFQKIISNIWSDIIIQIIGHTHGALFATRFLFFYSPLSSHNSLFDSSDNNFEISINNEIADNNTFEHVMPSFYETFSILCLFIISTLMDQILQISKNKNQLRKLNNSKNKNQELQAQLQEKLNFSESFLIYFSPCVVATFVLFSVEATGAQLNPALAFGMNYRALVYGNHNIGQIGEFFRHLLVFWVYPFIGVHVFSWFYVKMVLDCDVDVSEKRRHKKMVEKIKKIQ